jgi:glycosyltransferase involved in cell wall biosynthesis
MTTARPVRVLELRSVRGTGGGPEKTIIAGAAMADRERVEVVVCYLRDARDPVFHIDERAAQARVEYVEIVERHSFDTSVWSRLRQLVVDRRIDVLHAHEYKTDLLALMLSRSLGIPALATVHGWTGHSPRERWLYYPLDKRILARFPRLIAVSSEIARELQRHGADGRSITTVLNGIDAGMFRRSRDRQPSARAAIGVAPGEFAIGSVGRLEPQKRFDLLLEAFSEFRRAVPQARLVIAGDGSLRASLEEQRQRLGLADSCTLAGHVADVIGFHHALDLFVQSSDYEGTPNSVLEAMALETPIVATEAGGTAELVVDGEHGRIVPIGRRDLLLTAMRQAHECTDESRAMANAARRRVENELSFQSRVRRVEGIYQELAGRA